MSLHPGLKADVLVVGAGASGLPAAIGAARAGAQVICIEEDPVIGGAAPRVPVGSRRARLWLPNWLGTPCSRHTQTEPAFRA
jgi:glycine/D-amino acid oxidase-like deaminating enzyme